MTGERTIWITRWQAMRAEPCRRCKQTGLEPSNITSNSHFCTECEGTGWWFPSPGQVAAY